MKILIIILINLVFLLIFITPINKDEYYTVLIYKFKNSSTTYIIQEIPNIKPVSSTKIIDENESTTSQTCLTYTGPMQLENSTDSSLQFYADSEIKILPEKIMTQFYASGWKITITGLNISSVYYNDTSLGSIAGLTIYADKQIYLGATTNKIRLSLIHEIGHYYDRCVANSISSGADFINIYNYEKDGWNDIDNVGDDYGKSSSEEYFASCFLEYFKYPENLKTTAPITFDFIDKLING